MAMLNYQRVTDNELGRTYTPGSKHHLRKPNWGTTWLIQGLQVYFGGDRMQNKTPRHATCQDSCQGIQIHHIRVLGFWRWFHHDFQVSCLCGHCVSKCRFVSDCQCASINDLMMGWWPVRVLSLSSAKPRISRYNIYIYICLFNI